DRRHAGGGCVGAGGEFELDHRTLPRRNDLARLLRRYHRELALRHAVDGAGFPAGAEAAGRGDRRAWNCVRTRHAPPHSRQSDTEYHYADLPVRSDQAVAERTANPVIRLADRAVPT